MSRTKINYRKIWENYHQACLLPGIHIHHIDGNSHNNNPINLIAVSPDEHAIIHEAEGLGQWISLQYYAAQKGGHAQGNINKNNGHWNNISKLGRSSIIRKQTSQRMVKDKLGLWSNESKKKSVETQIENKIGIHSPESKKKSVATQIENKIGIHSPELRTKLGIKNGMKNVINGNIKKASECAIKANSKTWLVWKDGVEPYIIENMNDFCRSNNLSAGTMNMVSNGERKQHKGWKCKKL